MKKQEKQSQEEFDRELRRELREAEEAQKRVWEKIQKMSEKERREMAARVPGPEERDERPGRIVSEPMPKRRLGGMIKLGALAAAALLVVISSGTFSIGNKEYEYHVIENSGNGIANNDDALESTQDINNVITMFAGTLHVNPVLFGYWPEEITISEKWIYTQEGYGIIECLNKGEKIYIEIYKSSANHTIGIANSSRLLEKIWNTNIDGDINLYEVIENDERVTYLGTITYGNVYLGISGITNKDTLKEILEKVEK